MQPNEEIGRCPKCGGPLRRHGDNLECAYFYNRDYIIPEKEFDRIWNKYPLEQLREESGTAEALLQELLDANIQNET